MRNVRDVTPSFVYEHPNIARLAQFMSYQGSSTRSHAPSSDKLSEMENMAEAHSQDLPLHSPTSTHAAEDTVLLTGSTGGLGAAILARLLRDTAVRKVFAINRRSGSARFSNHLSWYLSKPM